MIARFIGVVTMAEEPGMLRVAFMDHHEMSWFVKVQEPITLPRLVNLLATIDVLASGDPTVAIQAGIITKEEYEEALAARDKARADRADSVPKVH